jgi:hypothetical protein
MKRPSGSPPGELLDEAEDHRQRQRMRRSRGHARLDELGSASIGRSITEPAGSPWTASTRMTGDPAPMRSSGISAPTWQTSASDRVVAGSMPTIRSATASSPRIGSPHTSSVTRRMAITVRSRTGRGSGSRS